MGDRIVENIKPKPLRQIMKKYQLRPYQEQCVKKILWSQKLEGNEVACLPVGSGKSIILAELAHRLQKPILILAPSKELLEQDYEKLNNYVDKSEIGIYSNSMHRKDINFFTFGTIQSCYKKPELFKDFKCVIVDEAQNVDPRNLDGMYTSFFQSIGFPKVIGLSATPFRLSLMYRMGQYGLEGITTTKLITRMKGFFWKRIIFNIDHEELVKQGYLAPLRYLDKSVIGHQDIPLNTSHSEFDLEKFEKRIIDKHEEIITALLFAKELSKNCLVFCTSVQQAADLAEELEGEVVSANTPSKERQRIVQGFRDGAIPMVFNVGIFSEGFDKPNLDMICLVRPTRSLALHCQQLGRGARPFPGKNFCRVLDLVGNIKGLGTLESLKIVKREKWEIETNVNPNWHNYPLDSFLIAPKDRAGEAPAHTNIC